MNATAKLLEEFPPIATEAWQQAIANDLKGADPKALLSQTPEGLAVKPFYRAEDIAGLKFTDAPPGHFPYARGARSRAAGKSAKKSTRRIRPRPIARPALRWTLAPTKSPFAGPPFETPPISPRSSPTSTKFLFTLRPPPMHTRCYPPARITGCIHRPRAARTSAAFDPLANADFAAEVLAVAPPAFAPFAISAAHCKQAQANSATQIGVALAAAVEYLAAMSDRGVDIDRAATAVEFSFTIAANYFFEIAKLRAFRMAWARVVESFAGSRSSARARIAARTTAKPEAAANAHCNILRGATAAMAAVLGGADSIIVAPFDEHSKSPNESSRRLARNTQLLLRHEAGFARVADAAGGSYYLESITDFLARAAWKTVQEIESRGGYRMAGAGFGRKD